MDEPSSTLAVAPAPPPDAAVQRYLQEQLQENITRSIPAVATPPETTQETSRETSIKEMGLLHESVSGGNWGEAHMLAPLEDGASNHHRGGTTEGNSLDAAAAEGTTTIVGEGGIEAQAVSDEAAQSTPGAASPVMLSPFALLDSFRPGNSSHHHRTFTSDACSTQAKRRSGASTYAAVPTTPMPSSLIDAQAAAGKLAFLASDGNLPQASGDLLHTLLGAVSKFAADHSIDVRKAVTLRQRELARDLPTTATTTPRSLMNGDNSMHRSVNLADRHEQLNQWRLDDGERTNSFSRNSALGTTRNSVPSLNNTGTVPAILTVPNDTGASPYTLTATTQSATPTGSAQPSFSGRPVFGSVPSSRRPSNEGSSREHTLSSQSSLSRGWVGNSTTNNQQRLATTTSSAHESSPEQSSLAARRETLPPNQWPASRQNSDVLSTDPADQLRIQRQLLRQHPVLSRRRNSNSVEEEKEEEEGYENATTTEVRDTDVCDEKATTPLPAKIDIVKDSPTEKISRGKKKVKYWGLRLLKEAKRSN